MTVWSCATCGVEYPETTEPPAECPICEDERQYVPIGGQLWTNAEELAAKGTYIVLRELETGLFAVTTEPGVGIAQQSVLVCTASGNLLWDPVGFVDDAVAAAVLEHGPVVAIASSHPHMFGAQVSWSRALGGVPVLVAEADREWVQRDDPALEYWSGFREVAPGLTLRTVGGHFPGSAVAYWEPGADGRGVLLSGDTLFPGPDGKWVTFMRSYPNAIPMSAAVVDRVAGAIIDRPFDRVYGNLGGEIRSDARAAIRRSADRYMAWVRGDHDDLT